MVYLVVTHSLTTCHVVESGRCVRLRESNWWHESDTKLCYVPIDVITQVFVSIKNACSSARAKLHPSDFAAAGDVVELAHADT